MLEALSSGFRSVKERIQGKRTLTEENIDEALRDLRISLLEADVNIRVVRRFLKAVKEQALGEVVKISAKSGDDKLKVKPGDHFIHICQQELEALMGPADPDLILDQPISKIMMIGLQGAGKTTTTAKLAKRLIEEGKKPLLVAADIYRPAAVDQLKVLGKKLDVPVYHQPDTKPPEICHQAMQFAVDQERDVVIFDTAGRLAIDESLMNELKEIRDRTQPDNILLVVDAMIGQDAVDTAKTFDEEIGINGFIMTKLDGDARGGAALSIKAVTGKPIKFLGMGEGLDALEDFRPEGLASRIMGFGDIVGLMHDFERVVDEEDAEKSAKKMLAGEFDMMDFVEQIRTIRQMGPLTDLLEKMPFFGGGMPEGMNIDDKQLIRVESMIQSMTLSERAKPELIEREKGRATRIAKGCGGSTEKDILDLVSRFKMMRKFMGALGSPGGGNLLYKLPGFKQFAQMQQLKGMDLQEMFGDMGGGMGGMGGMPGMPGMPGMGGMPGMPGGFPNLPPGYLPPGTPQPGARRGGPSSGSQAKQKAKRKKAKAARRKQRKK
jgi:signal recognition particle subunit SRP54